MGVEKMTILHLWAGFCIVCFHLSVATLLTCTPPNDPFLKIIIIVIFTMLMHVSQRNKSTSSSIPLCVCLRFRFTGSDGPSGFGFELTFRLKREAGETAPPTWPAELMQGLARYVFQSGKIQFQDCCCWQWSILRVNAIVNLCGVMKV